MARREPAARSTAHRTATPKAAPQQSSITSVTIPDRPATDSWIVSSSEGTSTSSAAINSQRQRSRLPRGSSACEVRMPKTAYSVKCAVLRTRKFVTHALGSEMASRKLRIASMTAVLIEELPSPGTNEFPQMRAIIATMATSHGTETYERMEAKARRKPITPLPKDAAWTWCRPG